MKLTNLYIVALLLSLSCGGCGNSDAEPDFPDPLYVSETHIDFEKGGDRKSMHIESHNIPWEVVGGASWVSISPRNGATTSAVNIQAEPNPVQADRRDTIFVNSTDPSYPITYQVVLRQHAATPN